jgi:ketosteroid isomerase-like protein
VRTKLSRPRWSRDRRTVGERFALRGGPDGAWRRIFGAIMRRPPRSRLRRLVLARGFARAAVAANRLDWELYTLNMRDDVEYLPPRRGGKVAWPGLEELYHGPEGARRFHEAWNEQWESVRFETTEMVDAGDRVVILGHMTTVGKASAAEVTQPYAGINFFEGSSVVRCEFFLDWEDGLRAIGAGPAKPASPG